MRRGITVWAAVSVRKSVEECGRGQRTGTLKQVFSGRSAAKSFFAGKYSCGQLAPGLHVRLGNPNPAGSTATVRGLDMESRETRIVVTGGNSDVRTTESVLLRYAQ